MSTGDQGPACRQCKATEARCAWNAGCCSGCSHFSWLDGDGNEKPKPIPVVVRVDARATCGTCQRQVSSRGRFDCPGLCADLRRAYDRDRYRQRAS